ncbi:MAG: glycosyltransferase [Spirochaetia bacterium]|nr:glycosyltransferase [Spirochaetia bacterium]
MAQKVLFVLPNLHGGGAERVVITLLNRLDPGVWEPVLAAGTSQGELREFIRTNICVYDLGSSRVRSALPALLKLAWKLKPGIIFSTLTHLNLAVSLLRPLLPPSVRLIAREGNLPSRSLQSESRPALYRRAYRLLYCNFDVVVAQSRRMAQDMQQQNLAAASKIRVIHNPVDTEGIRSQAHGQPRPEWPSEGARLLAVGRLTRQKGFDLLLQELAGLNRPWSLVILGEGAERGALEQQVRELGLGERVLLQGFEHNPYRWMAAADLFVLSSRYEGFPNVVLESLSCGTPVASYGGDTSADEIIRDGVDGFLAEPGHKGSLGGAIAAALDTRWDPSSLQESVRQRFGTEHIVAHYKQLFSEIK